jgi:hypothetical protein
VGRWKFLKQTTNIAPVILYTPPNGGIYRVTFVEETTIANGEPNPFWYGGVSWTNELGQNPATGIYLITQIPYSTSSTAAMRVAKGTPIIFSTSSHQDTSGAQYNIYVVLEEIEPL